MIDPQSAANIDVETNTAMQVSFSAQSLHIPDQEAYEFAGQMLLQISSKLKGLEKMRKFFTQPLNDQVKAINEKFKPSKQHYTQAQSALKRSMAAYMAEQAVRKQQALEAAQQMTNNNDTEAFYAMAQVAHEAEVFQTQGVHTRETWKFEALDLSKIPLDFLMVDEKKLRAFVKEHKDSIVIPGVRIYKDLNVVARTS